jgi:hypothetical protein
MTKRIDLTEQKFGKLTVVKYDHTEKPKGIAFYLCNCECGNTTIVSSGHLRNGHTQSCGCLQVNAIKKISEGNTWGRKYNDPKVASAKTVWQVSYADGCSFETFMLLSQQPCHYCGELPSNCFNKYLNKEGELTNEKVSLEWAKQAYFTYNGLDRVDSSVTHLENNVVPCCIKCNRAKRDMSISEFTVWLTKSYNHFIKEK